MHASESKEEIKKTNQISDGNQNETEESNDETKDGINLVEENAGTIENKKNDSEKNEKEIWKKIHDIAQDAKGNVYIQYQKEYLTNYGVLTGDGAKFDEVNFNKYSKKEEMMENSKLVVEDYGRLAEWISENYYTMKVPHLISCAVFCFMPYMWITEAAQNLAVLLHVDNNDHMNIFLQHDIKEFGAEVYKDTLNSNIGKTEVDYVRFLRKEYTQNILNCVWNSFSIRDVISTWLKDCMFMKRSTMTYRVNLTFVHFAKLDFHYFAHKIIKKLYDEKDIITDMGLVQIILGLEKDEICTSNIVKMIEQWSNLKERHHLLVILLYCTGNKDRIEYIERAVQHYLDWISQHFENMSEYEFNKIIREFLLVGMRDYMFYRILINKLYSLSLQRNINNYVCWLFLIMFFVDTDYSSFEEEYTKEAVFVKLAYSPNQVRSELCKLWQMLWSRNEFKQQFYYAMGRYFAKVPDNIRREKIVQFVSASFMGFCNESYKVDIIKRIDKQSRRLNNYE